MADRIVVMNHGVIEQIGTPLQVYREPASPFVADFVGLMNFVAGTVVGPGTVRCGELEFACQADGLAPGTAVTLAIRPEDVVVGAEPGANSFKARIDTMAFLGSFFRADLAAEAIGAGRLRAELSIELVRRRGLAEGHAVAVTMPQECIRVYPEGAGRG